MEPTIKDFHHPYKPYDIQSDLMNVIYQCIAEGEIGILESPTGVPFLTSSYDPFLMMTSRNCMSNERSLNLAPSLHCSTYL